MSTKKTSKKILIVDDEPNIRLLVRGMLSPSYVVLEASDGREAINIAHNQKPDLILMDIMMPVLDGYSACSAIKSDPATKDIPVIMLTAIGFELNQALAQKLGAAAYITKPFSHQALLEAIGQFS